MCAVCMRCVCGVRVRVPVCVRQPQPVSNAVVSAPISADNIVCQEECEGGAICNRGLCQCPKGYVWAAHRTKCAKVGGETARVFNSTMLVECLH